MIHETVSVDDVIALLNDMLRLDRAATSALVETRVPCNRGLTDHPTIQVVPGVDPSSRCVGLLGVLNGLFGVDTSGYGAVTAVFRDDEATVDHFERTPVRPANA